MSVNEKPPVEFSKPPILAAINEMPMMPPDGLIGENGNVLPPNGLIVENGNVLPPDGLNGNEMPPQPVAVTESNAALTILNLLWDAFIAGPITLITSGKYRPEFPL